MTVFDLTVVRRIPASSGSPTLTALGPIAKWSSLRVRREVGLPGSCQVVAAVDALESTTKAALLDLSATPCELWVYRDAALVHAGPIVSYRVKSRRVELVSPGLLGYLDYMVQDTDFASSGDQAAVVALLIDTYQAQAYGHFGLDTGHLDDTIVTRELTVAGTELHRLSDLIREYGAKDDGFDLSCDPESRRLTMHHPRQGVDRSDTVVADMRSVSDPEYGQSVAAGLVGSEAIISASGGSGINYTATVSNLTLRASFGRTCVTGTANVSEGQTSATDYATRLGEDYDAPAHALAPAVLSVSGFDWDSFDEGDVIGYEYDAGLGLQTFTPRVRAKELSPDSGSERLAVEFF